MTHEVYPPHGHGIPGHQGRSAYRPRNGLGLAAVIVGMVSLLGAIVPFVNLVAWIGGAVGAGLALGAFGRLRRREATNKGATIVGLIASTAAVALSLATCGNVVNAVSSATGPAQVTPAGPGATADAGTSSGSSQVRFAGGQAADVEGLVLVVEGLERRKQQSGEPVLCAGVRYTNNTDENQSYNGGFDWKLQSPGGTIISSTFATEKDLLPSGQVTPGSSVAGKVCFTDSKQQGEHVVIYEPIGLASTHVEWAVSR